MAYKTGFCALPSADKRPVRASVTVYPVNAEHHLFVLCGHQCRQAREINAQKVNQDNYRGHSDDK